MQEPTWSSTRAFALECVPPADRNVGSTICVQASPNPEYAVNPSNFAHWLLAHVQPLMAAAHAAGLDMGAVWASRLLIAHGHNRVLPIWAPQFAQLMGPGAACRRTASITFGRNVSMWHGHGCATALEVSVPKYSFCRPKFWVQQSWKMAASAIATRLRAFAATLQEPSPLAGRIVVLTRGSGKRSGNVFGLEAACNLTRVNCITVGQSLPLMRVATALGPGTAAIVAGHGAGLANLLFASPESRLAELDHIRSAEYARNFYQQLARQLGLRALPVPNQYRDGPVGDSAQPRARNSFIVWATHRKLTHRQTIDTRTSRTLQSLA